ncbi:N-6 DNA methylase [Patescibacteria group bacterium]|nr:N-6 DNA methylase [Patescibacteria group bacterium]
MLNQDTKRKIDSARQILVGKVPDPKAQVEQITTALIYKFMDDMDKEAQELGGKARFFTNGYEKYAWTKLMDTRVGGQDRSNLYIEAITSLSQNPHIPQLFRDIFKDTFLPYRSPETLSLFLKEVNGFSYDNSEDLGNAFEYLLSILGSQGDAGQFRTPRHIIDFIVDAVNPKKDETICDPACGTAGFLISAYKHILRQHDGLDDPKNKEKPLTPDERKTLMDHFAGYDISPDMVRLSKVNLYLHGFPSPTIFEYDTLSSEEKWDESFDVMLANPPFMSPKGGIKPHKRFSVQAKRSEVLFVDYILEHLRPKGRAGIIVPEGIIFQSAGAYKQLRKMLVEDGLFAVVSLPAGVFNPYAGVKTSILLFDNEIAKKTKNILFLKVQNDGYDLGAQRREHDKNDLPLALKIIKEYKMALKDGKDFKFDESEKQIAHLVAKEKIAKTGDYNLSGDRYIEIAKFVNKKYPIVEIGEFVNITTGKINANRATENGKYPFYTCGQEILKINEAAFEGESILLAGNGDFSLKYHTGGQFNAYQRTYVIKSKDQHRLLNKYLFHSLKQPVKNLISQGGVIQYLRLPQIIGIKLPLPPIEVQREIVEQIEAKQNAIDHAKAVIENIYRERRYFGQSLRKLEGVEWVELEELCEINPKKSEVKEKDIEVSFVPMTDVSEQNYYFEPKQTKIISEVYKGYTYFAENDVLLAKITPCFENGKSAIARKLKNGIGFGSTEFIVFRTNDKTIPEWIYNFVANTQFIDEGKNHMTGSAGQRRLNIDFVRKYKIPLPSLEIQKKLVAEAEKEQQIINANKQLIEIYEQKIADVLSEI